MDPVRFGLSLRALRRRRGWTQAELGQRAGVSQSVVSRVERGEAEQQTVDTLLRLITPLGARLRVSILAHGEDLDRLLDGGHAAIVERVAAMLRRLGWEVVPEATFNVYGERGSIDLLAFHPATGALLVIEVKSVVPDVQATLAGIDRKARLAQRVTIIRERGWKVRSVSRWLVLPDDRTARRRIESHATTFRAALPAGTVELRRWARQPAGAIAGILFVPDMPTANGRHRIRGNSGQSGRIPGDSGQTSAESTDR
jgi:transcriptional regulator with XRE-family HTH domain